MPRLRNIARLPVVAVAVAVFGVAFRVVYALRNHHPREHVASDSYEYIALAHRFLDAPEAQTLRDTIWPPGTSAVWAALLSIDGSLGLLAVVNVIASVLVMLLVTLSARLVAGSRAGWFALIFASLHLGLIHYVGFTLSEQLFQLTTALAVWSSLAALSSLSQSPQASIGWRALNGVATGLAWGLATLFRPNALPVFLVAAFLLAWHWIRRRERAVIPLVAGVVLGLLLVLVPASDRCTRNAGGHFCLVSNNIAMNMAMGQAGTVYGLDFRDPKTPANASGWVPPALLHHGYTGMGNVPATIYDTRGVLTWWWNRFLEDPTLFAIRALGNGFDLFDLHYWPDNFGVLGNRPALVWQQAFLLLVLIPGLLGLARLWRSLFTADTRRTEATLLCGVSAGVFVSAALTLGEARYRVPFDIVLLVTASMVYANAALRETCSDDGRWLKRSAVVVTFISGLCASVVLAVAHPAIGLGKHFTQRSHAGGLDELRTTHALSTLSQPRRDGAPWNERGTHVFRCEPTCRELVLTLDSVVEAKRVNLSVDHNDRYRVFFYRQHVLLGHADVRPPAGKAGLRNVIVQVPPEAKAGFDALGVAPLYGDGRYALGHVKLMTEPSRKEEKKTTRPR